MSKIPVYLCNKKKCENGACDVCHNTTDINYAERDEKGELIVSYYIDCKRLKWGGGEMKITANALIDALDSVTWYNGLGETLRKWRHTVPANQDSIVPYTMFWNKEIDINEYNQLQVIWMICVVLFGDYGTSPRSGWINDWDGFRDFIDKITTTYMEAEET